MAFGERMVFGLTGPTGCGKTQASLFLKSLGFVVVNADEIVKYIYLNCDELINKIGFRFKGVVENGVVNRRKLAKIVFSDEVYKVELEKIVWPFVLNEIKLKIERSRSFDVVLDAPLLFESGAFSFCNRTVAVLSSKQKRLARVLQRDRITLKEAMSRINSQPPDSFYINRADGVVFNDGLEIKLYKSLLFLLNRFKI